MLISLRRLSSAIIVFLLSAAAFACGGPALEGTYTSANGQETLDLKAGDQASFTVIGDTQTCTYKRDGAKLILSCPGQQSFDFTIGSDGSLTEATFGVLEKGAK